jgi:hypothetical protein
MFELKEVPDDKWDHELNKHEKTNGWNDLILDGEGYEALQEVLSIRYASAIVPSAVYNAPPTRQLEVGGLADFYLELCRLLPNLSDSRTSSIPERDGI